MIKVVIFDWGGVISQSGTPDELSSNFSKKINLNIDEAKEILNSGTAELKRGIINENEFWDILSTQHNLVLEEDHKAIWVDGKDFAPRKEMMHFLSLLKGQNIKTAILSNTFPRAAEYIRQVGWYDDFDVVLASSDTGFAKPDSEFYQMCLDQLNIRGDEAIFIDDQQYCLDAAQQFGIKTILATSPSQIIRDTEVMLAESNSQK